MVTSSTTEMDTAETATPKMGDVEQGGSEASQGQNAVPRACRPYFSSSYLVRLFMNMAGMGILGGLAAWGLAQYEPERGFYCNDSEIALPKKKETLPFMRILGIAVFAPFGFIALLELLLWRVRAGQPDREARANGIGKSSVIDIYRHIGGFFFGVLTCWAITDILKQAAGSLRPFFLQVCQPDWSKITCQDANGTYIYVPDAHCTTDLQKVRSARRSFPSGHSSFTMCGMVYTIMYLQSQFRWNRDKTAPRSRGQRRLGRRIVENLYWAVEGLTPVMQSLLLMMALYVPVTRVVDHFHHIRDVVTGCIIGACAGLHASLFVADLRRR